MSRPLRFLMVAVAAVAAAGIVLWSTSGMWVQEPDARLQPAASTPVPDGMQAQAGVPRDHMEDREMTSSAEAFQFYAEGVQLAHSLPAQAAERFRRAAMLDPGFAPAQYRLALADLLLSRRAEAAAAIRAATQHQDRLPEPYRSAGVPLAHFIDGAFDLTVAALEEAFARQPSDPDLHYLAGTINAVSCDYFDPNGVIEHYEKVLAADPDYPSVRAGLLVAYEMKQMHDWALARAQEYQASHPDLIEALAGVARVRIARGEYGDAVEAADEIVRRGQDIFAHGLAPAFILTGHHDQVIAMHDPEMERTNTASANVRTHLHAGINSVWSGRFGAAAEHFERGPEFLPAPWEKSDKALFYLLLGRSHSLLGRSREAVSALEAAQQVVGPQPVLEYALGVSHLRGGQAVDAERAARRLAQERRSSQPGWTEPWRLLLLGEIALAAGETTRAVDEIREAWQLEKPLSIDCISGHADAYFLDASGRGYLAAGRPQEALQAFEQIRALGVRGLRQPEIAVLAEYGSARALEQLGRQEESKARYLEFLKLWGDSEPPPDQVGDARARLRAMGGS